MAKLTQKAVLLKWNDKAIGTCTVEMEVGNRESFNIKDIEPKWINDLMQQSISIRNSIMLDKKN